MNKEYERELNNLVHVLQQTARMAFQSEWTGSGCSDAAVFCVNSYNRILARLREIDPDVSRIFEPLSPDSSLQAVAIACRQLAAYYEDDIGWQSRIKNAYDPQAFKEFWRKSAKDVSDLGEYMRECADEWTRRRKARAESDVKNPKP